LSSQSLSSSDRCRNGPISVVRGGQGSHPPPDSASGQSWPRRLGWRLAIRWIERNGLFEIAGVPAKLCREWSKRRAEIQQAMAERGTSGGRAAEVACLATRRPKPRAERSGDLHARLCDEASYCGRDPADILHDSIDLDRTIARLKQRRGARELTDEEIIDRLVGPRRIDREGVGVLPPRRLRRARQTPRHPAERV
jgi:hypothetical protein